jgi:hypothetical protein
MYVRGLLPDQHTALMTNFDKCCISEIPIYDDMETIIPVQRPSSYKYDIRTHFTLAEQNAV